MTGASRRIVGAACSHHSVILNDRAASQQNRRIDVRVGPKIGNAPAEHASALTGTRTGVHHAMTVCTGTAPPPNLMSGLLGLSDIANDHAAVIAVTAMTIPMAMLLFI